MRTIEFENASFIITWKMTLFIFLNQKSKTVVFLKEFSSKDIKWLIQKLGENITGEIYMLELS